MESKETTAVSMITKLLMTKLQEALSTIKLCINLAPHKEIQKGMVEGIVISILSSRPDLADSIYEEAKKAGGFDILCDHLASDWENRFRDESEESKGDK